VGLCIASGRVPIVTRGIGFAQDRSTEPAKGLIEAQSSPSPGGIFRHAFELRCRAETCDQLTRYEPSRRSFNTKLTANHLSLVDSCLGASVNESSVQIINIDT
jgi:hypothetical protein